MISPIHALILGMVQGITEFLPISSSGHLILVPTLLGWDLQSLSFDVALHLGTLLALILFSFSRLSLLLREKRLCLVLLVGTVPAVILGLLFNDVIETQLRSPVITALNLILFALVMFLAEKNSQQSKEMKQLSLKDGVFIGLFQALALIPGVSRSGSTIVGGLWRNLTAVEAAEFSFLLAIPVVAGAAVLELVKVMRTPSLLTQDFPAMFIGVSTAGIVGFLVIHGFLRFLKGHTLKVFIIYRILLGLLVLGML